MKEILRRLKKKKAPGPDGIPNMALRLLPKKGIAHLVAIANASLRLRYFPAKWKEADVVVLLKPGKSANFPQNYRPISLLPTMGKIMEKIILTRLDREVEALELIQPEQFGFRSQHSTTHQALRVVEQITRGFGRREATGALFLDISKAFDKVWHQGLLWKMLNAGISLAMVQLIHSFLRRRSFRVKLPSCRSTSRPILSGVPQGSVLAPRLFNIYVSDVPKTVGTSQALYADDTAILASGRNAESVSRRLQTAVDALEDWYVEWRFDVNPEKSTAVVFQRRRLLPGPALQMYGRRIPWTNQANT
jgi:Reverse transcriptase (RNA-dependent DNA polymerase)